MRAVSACAAVALLAATLHVAAQQPAPGAQPKPARPSAAAPKRPPTTPARPRTEAAVPFQVGETLTYDVAWSNYLVAGSAVSRVVEKRTSAGSAAYYIVAEGKPIPLIARFYSVYYKMDALLDSFSTLSQRTTLYTEEGSRKRFASTMFNRSGGWAQFEVQSEPPVQFRVPANVQDGLSTLYALRGHAFRAGDHLTVPVADDGTMYTASFDVSGPTPLKVPMGVIDAWNLRVTVVDGSNKPVGQNIAAFISADARRLPVKLQADLPVGSFALALRTAE